MTIETRTEPAVAHVLQPSEGSRVDNLGLRLLSVGASTGGKLMAAVCSNPGPGGPPMHLHHSVDEFYFVLEGRYRIAIGDDVHEGGPGTYAYVPRETAHTFASVGPDEGQLLAFTLPAADGFIRRLSELQAQGVDQRQMVDLFREYDSEICGPPLV